MTESSPDEPRLAGDLAIWLVILAELLHPLDAIQAQRCGNGQQPAEHVAKAVQIKAVQAQWPAHEGEPSRHGFVFHRRAAPR